MRSPQDTATVLESPHVPVQAKLAAAWTSVVLLYAYVDIIGFYKPGTIDDILVGVVFVFDITQVWAITVLALMAVPILMVLLSAVLPARANRITNLVVASLQVPYATFNVLGGSWTYYYGLGVVLEVVVLVVILRLAWTWPSTAATATTATTPTADRGSVRL